MRDAGEAAMTVRILHGDCRDHMAQLAADSVRVHAVVTDPPYGIDFMGKKWDARENIAFQADTWRRVFDVMLPGAYLAAFGGTRQWHRMACAIEDAGFEIRDTIFWCYGVGFPKSLNVAKAVNRHLGADDEAPLLPAAEPWSGFGTALKPAVEPIVLARRPLDGTVARNVLTHGCGALNIDACRVEAVVGDYDHPGNERTGAAGETWNSETCGFKNTNQKPPNALGRWPANLIHDGSDEVEAAFAAFGESKSVGGRIGKKTASGVNIVPSGNFTKGDPGYGDTGSASRFFYSAKASKLDRSGSAHPTVKPTALMEWLVQLVTPPGGTVLDPFAGTGSTGLAAQRLGMEAILIEQDAEYVADIKRKLAADLPARQDTVAVSAQMGLFGDTP